MTDAAGAVVWRASYLPFGEVHSITGPASLDARFPGQWFMAETAIFYNWHRWYNSNLGRYTQPDPLGLEAGANRYAYALNSPLMYTDPDGQNPRIVLELLKRLTPAARKIWKDLNFDGPSPGLDYGNGRVCQVRYKKQPVIRLDYQPIPGSGGQSRAHIHFGKSISTHYSIDPRSMFD